MTVGTSYEEGVFTVGFAAEGGGGALLFSRSDTVDERHALLGQDTYCISTETGATFYGGVESARLTGAVLELRFSAQAHEALEVPSELDLLLGGTAAAKAAVDGLRKVGIVAMSV